MFNSKSIGWIEAVSSREIRIYRVLVKQTRFLILNVGSYDHFLPIPDTLSGNVYFGYAALAVNGKRGL